ncbi:MAG TPA: hypothetical protein VKG43_11815 [Acidimicrobiales bacterium]|nr:hypothetical protein [Acidimicrobiales bacterium]
MIMVSFDIDGTLEVGDPPGPITLAFVRAVKEKGCLIGSSSDRTVAEQHKMWAAAGIAADFVGHKHHLDAVRERFVCTRRVHIGDTHVDEYYASLAGFEYWDAHAVPDLGTAGWIL